MCSLFKFVLTLLPVLHMSYSMLVVMNEPHIRVFDNGNITLTCRTKKSTNESSGHVMGLSVRARMVLTFLQIPRGGQIHQVHGVLHCDPMRTNCESEFNVAVDCIAARINISKPMDTLESACQLVDDQVCSIEWLKHNRYDCVALGTITVIKGPKLGERCVIQNQTIEQILPCGENQYCSTEYRICQCVTNYVPGEKRKCVAQYPEPITPDIEDHRPDSLELSSTLSPKSEDTTIKIAGLPSIPTDPTKKSNNRKTSKALVIFLLIVAIILCIALAVVVIWSYSRNRSLAANVSN